MAVIRVSKTKGFTVMSNYHLRDQNLSLKAKGLLSMMLSLPDGWHYNVRGLAAICKEGVTSISSALKELDQCGYIRRHQPIVDGKFQEIEYIIYEKPQPKNVEKQANKANARQQTKSDNISDPDTGVPCSDSTYSDSSDTDFAYPESPCTENLYTVNPDAEFPNTDVPHTENRNGYINTNPANTERLNTGENNYPSINHRGIPNQKMDESENEQYELLQRIGAQRMTSDFETYREIIQENIDFDMLCTRYDRDTLEGLVEIMVEVVCSKAPYTRIGGQDFPTEIVKARFLKLDSTHIEYVLTALSQNTNRVRNLKAYLLTTLYNARSTINPYYENWVLSDNPQFAQR